MTTTSRWQRTVAAIRVDTTPLRTSRDFRVLFIGGAATSIAAFIAMVAVPFQIYQLTQSNLAVGISGAIQVVPLIILGLYGGALADHVDRRTMIVWSSIASVAVMAALLVNSLLAQPHLWVIYAVALLSTATSALQRPSREALIPLTVAHDDLPAALALSSMVSQTGMLLVPAVAGVALSLYGAAVCYLMALIALMAAVVLLIPLSSYPHTRPTEAPSVQGIVAGVTYAAQRKDLLGSYVIDFVGMLLAMPIVLFPALAEQVFGQPHLLGLLYSAEGVGALIASATAGWTARIHHHGRAITLSALLWGAMIGLAGVMPNIWLAIAFFALAGAFDTLSGIFRGTLWHQTIPNEIRGRLAGIEMLSYSLGPLGAQVRSGIMGDLIGVQRAIAIGGGLCVAGVAGTAASLRTFWAYDSRTDPHAIAQRERRQAESAARP